ncbi:MAG TPA: DUF1569 domain-containing protein [Terracidiphilus sp.]|nr:DUF1569 domain-containing protein [Terracidiphilus sp.]
MKHMFEAESAEEIKQRLQKLRPDSRRQWGKMSATQMLAHCSAGLEMALGATHPPRMLIGRLMGPLVKPLALMENAEMRRNVPTAKILMVDAKDLDFRNERTRLIELITHFAAGGSAACTTHPHFFFGKLSSKEWSILMYKHLDHHLRQFGA